MQEQGQEVVGQVEVEAVKPKRVVGRPFGPNHKGGRPKGRKNNATLAWKEFVTKLCSDPAIQKATRKSILEGRTDLVFKAAEHAHGKPKETVEVKGEFKMIQWPDDEDVSED